MNQAAEKFVALNKRQAEMAIRAFQIGFGAWEMLIKLNLEATRSLLEEGMANISSLPTVGDMAGLSAWSGQFQAAGDKLSGYSRNVYEIGGQAAKELGNLLEQSLLVSNQEVLEWVEEALKTSSIPQTEATAAAGKDGMADGRPGIERISNAGRETARY